MSGGAVVHELRRKLQKELLSRQRQEELNAKLQDEYDLLLKRLAEAELHIDRLRLGPSVDINRRFVERRGVEQRTRLRERLQSRLGSSLGAQPGSGQANEGPKGRGVQLSVGVNTEPSEVAQKGEPLEEVKESAQSLSGGVESRVSLSNISSLHSTESLSQMSAENIANRVSAESTQMAHLFQIRNLQEQMTVLKEKINNGGASVSDIMTSLRKIQEEHRQLVADIASSSADLDALNRRDSRHLVHSQKAIGNELSSLADQLKDLEELLRTKGGDLLHSPASTSTTHVPLSATEGERLETTASEAEGGGLSDHSLDSPVLPSKYTFILDDNHSPPITSPPGTPPHLNPSPPHSNSHRPSSQPSGLDISSPVPTRHDGSESQDTLSENCLSGELSSQLLHHQSSNDSGCSAARGSTHSRRMSTTEATAATSTSDSLLVANESALSFQQFSSASSTVTPSHVSHPPPPAHSPPPHPNPVTTPLQTTLSESENGTTRDTQLPPHSPPHHPSHLDPTHPPGHTPTKSPSTNSHYTSSNEQSPLPSGFKPAPYPTHPPPCEWSSSQKIPDGGFAGSELPQRRPDSGFAGSEPPQRRPNSGFVNSELPQRKLSSACPTTLSSSRHSVAGSGTTREEEKEEDEDENLPLLTTAAIDALRAELEDLKNQILNSSRPHPSTPITPHHHSKYTEPLNSTRPHPSTPITPHHHSRLTEPLSTTRPHPSTPITPHHHSKYTEPLNSTRPHPSTPITPHHHSRLTEPLSTTRPHPSTPITPHHHSKPTEPLSTTQPQPSTPSTPHHHSKYTEPLNSIRPQASTPITPHHHSKLTKPLSTTRPHPSTPITPHHHSKYTEPLNSTRPQTSISNVPYHHSIHTEPLHAHSRMTTDNDPPVSMTTTVGLQTDWQRRDTLRGSLSAQVAPLTCTKATNTPAGGPDSSQAWQHPVRSFHQASQTDHLLQSPLSSRAHGERYSTPPPSLLKPSQLGKMNMESEVEQKLSFGHTSTDSETSSSVCSHSEAAGHDQWVCSKCGGAGYDIEGTTGRVQGRKHRSRSNRGAQVTFDHQEGDEVGYQMSEPKVPLCHAQHLPCSSKLGGSNLDDHHLLDTNRYQPTSSHLAREYMFQPSVLFGQRPVATSTPSNLDKYRHRHIQERREHFSPSIAPAELCLSLPENLTGATPPHTRVRERASQRRYSNTRHIPLADSSSEDEQEVGYASPEQYYDHKKHTKPRKTGYYSGASYTSRRSQFRAPYLPATDEVYFSDPTVVSPQRRRRSGVGRVVVTNPRSVEGMYLMEGEHSSGSEAETIEAVSLDLSDACRLARKMSRRSRRMHGTLQIELGRQSSFF